MITKDIQGWLDTWKPLIQKSLSRNFIKGLDREDLEQEIWLVIWECFVKREIHFPTTYIQNSIHNRIVDLYEQSQRFYYPSLRFRCTACTAVTYSPKRCTCGNTHFKNVKGVEVATIEDYEVYYYPEFDEVIDENYPEEIKYIIERILSGKKTGFKQKQLLRDYLNGT